MYVFKDVRYKNIISIDALEIREGEITCIVGESGSGKTTLLRLLNKLISCDSGTITYNGDDLASLDPVALRRSVVMLPQIPPIFPGTVKDNLLIGLQFSEKEPVDDAALLNMLEFVHLAKKLEDEAERLSGGEKQRLALARVLLLDPAVLLLDEPSSALDEETANLVIEKVVAYTKDNKKTLIMVTHSKEISKMYSDRIIHISAGKVVPEP